MTPPNLLGALGAFGIGMALFTLGILSKRLGAATRARPFYGAFFVAAAIFFLNAALQASNALFNFASPDTLATDPLWLLAYQGLPAIGITIALIFAWRYWSWLLAERA